MRRIPTSFSLSAGALAASMLVAACGGGSASAPNLVPGSTGFAVDGATVLCDTNGNAESDAGELSVKADDTGFFKFDPACSAGLVATGGTSTDTNLPFKGKLKAPPGSTMVTPLTTLMANGMTLDQVNAALGLPSGTDVTKVDPARSIGGDLQNADLYRATLATQQILQKTAETLANLVPGGATAALPAIYSEVAAAVAAQLRANPGLASGGTINATALATLVNAAATRVASSLLLSAEVRAAAASVNPASLAQVVSGALKVQTERILKASNALLVSTTSTAQLDSRIADFVLQNRSALAGAPNATTTSLASDIATTVGGGVSPPPPPPPPSGTVLISWDEATLPATNIGSFGDGGPSVAAAPTGGSGNALKLDRSGAINFGGTFFNVPAVPFAADRKTITARVYATRANAVVYLKVEAPGGVFTEVPATVTAANTWQTLTWVLNGVNPASSYTTMVFSADTDVPNLGAQTYWIDDITLLAAAGGGGGGGSTPITFSSGFAANGRTVEGGEFGGFSGSNLDGFNCTGGPAFCGGGGDTAPGVPAADSFFFYYYQTPTPATALFAGIYVQPPGVTGGLSGTANTGGVQISGQTTMRFNFNQNPEWFQSATNNFMVQLDMGRLYTVGGNPCHIQLRRVVTPTSVASVSYTLNLSEFVVVQNCAVPGMTTAAALAGSPIAYMSFQAAGGGSAVGDGTRTSGANLSVPAGAVYPSTLVLKGAITFQ
jgi:hypothetical protein